MNRKEQSLDKVEGLVIAFCYVSALKVLKLVINAQTLIFFSLNLSKCPGRGMFNKFKKL